MITRLRVSRIVRLLAICMALACSFALSACQKSEVTDRLSIIFLDVGQGDAALLRAPEGDILIDAGGEDTEVLLCSRLRALGVSELTLAVFTSSATERIGGADRVLTEFKVHEVWYNGSFDVNESAERLGVAVERLAVNCHRAEAFSQCSLGDTTLAVLFPILGDRDSTDMVLQLVCGEMRALWMGNASAEEEQILCETYDKTVLRSALLSVGRHGSGTATGQSLLDAVSPQYAVISCAVNNPYGYPTGELLAALNDANVRVLRTDRQGEIVICCDGHAFYLPEAREE